MASRGERTGVAVAESRYAGRVRPAVARTVVTFASLVALGAAAAVAACGAFSAEPAATPDGGNDVPDAAAEATAADAGPTGETCEILFTDDFTSLAAFEPQSNDAGPATLSKDSAHGVMPPSLAAVGKLVRGTGYLNSSAARGVALPAGLAAGDRVELEYDLFIDDPIDTYAEVGCTLQLFDAKDVRTRLLLVLPANAAIQATVDPADPTLKGQSKNVFASRVAGDYRVKTTFAATGTTTANVHYEVRTGSADFTDVPVPAPIDRVRLVCGIDYAISDASAPVTLHVWVDDVVVRRCTPKP
jgi:hypothetical protein